MYRIPRAKLRGIQPDLDYLDEFQCLELVEVDSGFWPILAARLKLGSPRKVPLAVNQEGGLAVFEWSPAFIKAFVKRVDPDLNEAAIYDLVMEQAIPGLDLSMTRRAVGKLKGFLSKCDLTRHAVVEHATF
jgi:hypothetical protein